jgi:hypothetical protein
VVVEAPDAAEERPKPPGLATLRRATTIRTVRLSAETVGRALQTVG